MKYILSLFIILGTVNAFSLSLEDIALDKSLKFNESKGPKYRKSLEEHALEEWGEVTDLGNLIDDGLIHDVYEGACDPDVYQIDDVEVVMNDWPSMHVVFDSIKRGSKSIAYIATPVVTYTPTYRVYKTHADYKKGKITKLEIDCDISSGDGFYYEHNKDQKVIYIGYTADLNEYREEDIAEPTAGVLLNGLSTKDETVALSLFKQLKAAEKTDADVNVCYFGDWEQAVDSASRTISIGVIDIYAGGELEVEVRNFKTNGLTSGRIKTCD